MFYKEDGVWRHYGVSQWWVEKCRSCREKVMAWKIPVQECVDCWKVEIWEHSSFAKTCDDKTPFGLPLLESFIEAMYLIGESPVAKITLGPIQVVRTGLPADSYPPAVIDRLLILYASSIEERNHLVSLSHKVSSEFLGGDRAASVSIPTRRGCWRYDPLLGPWQGWFAVDKDWGKGS